MTARKSKTVKLAGVAAGAAFTAAEAKARPWAAWVLALALLGCLTAWLARETTHTKTLQAEKRESTQLAEDKKALLQVVTTLRAEIREKSSTLEQMRKSSSGTRKGKKTKDAAGNETEEWEERFETLEEAISQIEQERDEAQFKLTQIEQHLQQANTMRIDAEERLAQFEQDQTKQKGFGPLLGVGFDLTRLGDPAITDVERLRLTPGAHLGPWSFRAGFNPMALANEIAVGASGNAYGSPDWSKAAPSVEAELRFP